MSEIKIDDNYKDSFNLGYELARELNLKSPMFNDLKVGDVGMAAMQAGIEQFIYEINHEKGKSKGFGLKV